MVQEMYPFLKASNDNLVIGSNMKEKKIVISSKDITQKQWAILVLELNLIRKAWKPYCKLELAAPGLKKIVKFGTRRHDKRD